MSFIWERSAHRFHSRYRESTVTETFKFIQSLKHRTARLVVSIHYDRWFDGLDLSAISVGKVKRN